VCVCGVFSFLEKEKEKTKRLETGARKGCTKRPDDTTCRFSTPEAACGAGSCGEWAIDTPYLCSVSTEWIPDARRAGGKREWKDREGATTDGSGGGDGDGSGRCCLIAYLLACLLLLALAVARARVYVCRGIGGKRREGQGPWAVGGDSIYLPAPRSNRPGRRILGVLVWRLPLHAMQNGWPPTQVDPGSARL
jgi:hypothetical protein